MTSAASRPPGRRRRGRAVLVGVGALIALELVLRLPPLAPLTREDHGRLHRVISVEHYYKQHSHHFAHLDDDGGAPACGPAPALVRRGDLAADAMAADRFPCTPPAGTTRIVTVGGSSVQGYGLRPDETLARQLEVALAPRAAAPVEVINAGVAGYNTLQVSRLLPELWPLQPDALVLYAGHNDYAYHAVVEDALRVSPATLWLRATADRLALWRGIRALLQRAGVLPGAGRPADRATQPFDGTEGAILQRPPLATPTTRRGRRRLITEQREAERTIVALHRRNVTAIAGQAAAHGVALLLVTPVARVDTAPPASMHWALLSDGELERFDALWGALQADDPPFDDPRFADALAIDDTHSALLAHAARAAQLAARYDDARTLYLAAHEHTPPTYRMRAPARMGDVVIELADELGVPAVDLRPVFDDAATWTGVPSTDLFRDSLHFSARGAGVAAGAIGEALVREGIVSRGAGGAVRDGDPGS